MAALFVPTGAVGLDDSAVVRDFGQGEKATRQMQPGKCNQAVEGDRS